MFLCSLSLLSHEHGNHITAVIWHNMVSIFFLDSLFLSFPFYYEMPRSSDVSRCAEACYHW